MYFSVKGTHWGQIHFEVGCEIKVTFEFTRYFPSFQVLKVAFSQKLRCSTNICAKSQSRAENLSFQIEINIRLYIISDLFLLFVNVCT